MAKNKNRGTAAPLGFEAKLWAAAEYKHVVLGLIFLKCISDAFEAQRAKFEAERAKGADPEDEPSRSGTIIHRMSASATAAREFELTHAGP